MHKESSHFCPAIAINKKYLLASQSCVKAFGKPLREMLIYPVFPSNSIRAVLSNRKDEVPTVASILHHDQFRVLDDGGVVNDLSLIEADLLLTENDLIPVCLPSTKAGIVSNLPLNDKKLTFLSHATNLVLTIPTSSV